MVYKVWYDLHFIEQETEVQSWESSYNESRTVEGRSVITLMSLPELLKFPFLLVVLLSTAMIFFVFSLLLWLWLGVKHSKNNDESRSYNRIFLCEVLLKT